MNEEQQKYCYCGRAILSRKEANSCIEACKLYRPDILPDGMCGCICLISGERG